jgi:hypothetical protein
MVVGLGRTLAPALWLAIAGCGPGSPTGGGSGTGDTGSGSASTSASASVSASVSASDEGGPTSATTSPPSTSATTATTDDGGVDSTSSTGEPPGTNCPKPPVIEPPLPEGCEHAWLVDANGNPVEGAWSGYVTCPDPDREERLALRTGFVPCPELFGECMCDADCERGEACLCASTLTAYPGRAAENYCMQSDCASADDCPDQTCRVDIGLCVGAWFPESTRCTTPSDDCYYDSECTAQGLNYCNYDDTTELFTCSSGAICE